MNTLFVWFWKYKPKLSILKSTLKRITQTMGKPKSSALPSSCKREEEIVPKNESDSENSESGDEFEEAQSQVGSSDEQTESKNDVKLLDYGQEEADEEDEEEEVNDDELEEDEENPRPSLKDIIESSKSNGQNSSLQEKKKPGVIYLGNLPPGMKPNFVKSLISVHGNIKRQYIEPEDDAKRKRRVALGGSGGLRYTEGWIEFETKKEAKEIALLLNGTRIGRKKGSRFYDDFWMVKYLKGFTWEMLVEKSIIQRKERENRLRLELAKAKKEDEAFLHSVAQSKRIKANEAKQQQQGKDKSSSSKASSNNSEEGGKKRVLPRQLAPIVDKSARAKLVEED